MKTGDKKKIVEIIKEKERRRGETLARIQNKIRNKNKIKRRNYNEKEI